MKKIELKVDVKYLRPPPDNLVKMKANLCHYFGEDPNKPPENMSEPEKCAYRQRQIFTLAGNNMNSIFELLWKGKEKGKQELLKVRECIMQNINSGAASARDYLIAISTDLALTSINPDDQCQEFETMSEWSKRLYETRQTLSSTSKRNQIYLEPYLFMTMFNWPRENTTQIVPPTVVKDALAQWKHEFDQKYTRPKTEGRSYDKKERTLFFLASGIGMGSVYYTPKHDPVRVKAGKGSEVFWQQEHIKEKLQRFEGVLERGGMSVNYRYCESTLNIPTSIPIVDRSWWGKKVNFVIGFSWAAPKAYNMLLA